MQMVAVVALRDFQHDGRLIHRGESVQLSALQASEHARRGNVSLDRLRAATYQTRQLVAEDPPTVVQVSGSDPPPFIEHGAFNPDPTPPPEPQPVKRRRGRPRKQPAS